MKKMFFYVLAIMPIVLHAQNCGQYFFLQAKKTVEMAVSDKKGKPNGKQVYKVQEVSGSGSSLVGSVVAELYTEKGKLQATNEMQVKCMAGVLTMDMRIFIPEEQAKQFQAGTASANQMSLEYLSDMRVGDKLKDGNIVVNIDNNGLKQKLTVLVSERIVEAAEKVTTPAGTWDTFKIHYKTAITIETLNIPVKINFEGVEWFAPHFGTVKTLSKYGATEVVSVK